MLPAVIVLFAAQASSTTPAPSPTPTPVAATPVATPTPTPSARVPAGPRTLQDVARERRLKTTPDAKGTGTTITLGSVPGATPAATPSVSPAASAAPAANGEAPAGDAPTAADIRVVTVSNDGIVDPVGAVRVSGTIRNAGEKTACGVVILVRILDNKGNYLASAQTPADVNILPAGETTSFHTSVQAPPGVRGARTNPDRRDVTDGSTTMAGDWKLLGGAEAKIVDATACQK